MTGAQVRAARRTRGWKQQGLAEKLGVSQGYVSLVECNRRPVPRRLATKLASVLEMPATALPVHDAKPLALERVTRALGALGYEGFGYLRGGRRLNPADVLLGTLRADSVDGRVVEALPWLLVRYPDLNWDWVVRRAKQEDLQNRLGFVVSLARGLAESRAEAGTTAVLRTWERLLEDSRLQKDDSFSRPTLTSAEERWLRAHRSPEARHWNLLSTLSVETIRHAG